MRLLVVLSLLVAPAITAAQENTAPRIEVEFVTGWADPVVRFINEQIRVGWADNEIKPSKLAADEEWLRRVSIDLAGRIPTLDESQRFLRDRSETKRADLIADLLDSPDFVERFADAWTTLLIGRDTPRRTNREALNKFLRDSVAAGRGWDVIVSDLVTAEGHFEENGAANFLLAKLDGNPRDIDYHVEATASVTRLFLGMQVQCTQCHNHPFNDWKQDQFWEFNSFMRQMRRVDHRGVDPDSGRQVDLYSELLPMDYDGPVFFEKRSGLMQVAYPTYFGESVDPGPGVDRRAEFARMLAEDADGGRRIAKAFVNRTWSQLMGYAFTRPVDDMGPHNPPSHPEIMDRLAEEFVASGYDVRRLVKWIANSEAYNLTSSFNRDGSNEYDNPAAGEVPLFSHMSVKTLSSEQLYDSLAVATGSDAADREMRNRWLRQLIDVFGESEDEDATLFSGSIPQALLMMNGPMVQKALRGDAESPLTKILSDESLRSDKDRMRAIYLAVLTRRPTNRESTGLSKMIKAARSDEEKLTLYQDLYWALLNSNEFAFNH